MAKERFLDHDGLAYFLNKLPQNFALRSELEIDYDSQLAFDTSEIVFGANTSPILGRAILGQMILA